MSITETCQVRIPDGGRLMSSHTCGKKLSGSDDYPELCGQHASAKRRAQSKKSAREEAEARLNQQREADAARVVALNAKLGTKALLCTVMATAGPEAFIGKSTGEVTITIAELEALALRLSSPDASEIRYAAENAHDSGYPNASFGDFLHGFQCGVNWLTAGGR